jgi:membrane protein DedA with SNARE-associated domain
MDPVTARLIEALPTYGPWLVFVMAALETSLLIGFFVPAGLATSVGTVLALQGTLSLAAVVAAALVGGALGDSLGFWVGRVAGERVLSGRGRLGRMVTSRERRLGRFFGRQPVYSVTVARTVAFVRTVMPIVAGVSGIKYARFLVFDLAGVAVCVGLYVGIGTLSEGSWQILTRLMGVGGALTLIALVVVSATWLTRRHAPRHGEER